MSVLGVRQCPRCVLRFGSSSELRQHLAADHRPPRKDLRTRDEQAWPLSAADDPPLSQPKSSAVPAQHRPQTSGLSVLIFMVMVTLIVAPLSWRVAVVLTIPLFVTALFYNDRRRSTNHG
jgi:hypothetical protein